MKRTLALLFLLIPPFVYALPPTPSQCPDLTLVNNAYTNFTKVNLDANKKNSYFVQTDGPAFIDPDSGPWYGITYYIHAKDSLKALMKGRENVKNAYKRISIHPYQQGNNYECRYFGHEAIIIATFYSHPNFLE